MHDCRTDICKVVFDDVFFNLGNSGIARVWRSVFQLADFKSALSTANIDLVILNRSGSLTGFGFPYVDFPKYDSSNAAMDRLLIDSVIKEQNACLFVSSYYTTTTICESVFVVYDLIPEKFGFANLDQIWQERTLGLLTANNFLAISNSTKSDLVSHVPWISPENVSVAYPGVIESIEKVDRRSRVFSSKHGLNKFAIWVGSREAGYKNSELIFNALASNRFDIDFVFVGGSPFRIHEIRQANRKQNRILHLNLDDADLFQAISESEVLLYPSLYEGFGLPPLEALALGVPVITTNSSSLPEATGGLSTVISGRDVEELKLAIAKATSNKNRSHVRKVGPQWAKKFNWGNFASGFVSALVEVKGNKISDESVVNGIIRQYSIYKSLL